MQNSLQTGLVMRSTGSWYQVLQPDDSIIDCRIKGKFRLEGIKTTNPVAVGDKVGYEDMGDSTGVIRLVESRKNYIIRKSVNLSRQAHIIAANIDRAYLIITLVAPVTTTEFIDRFLVTARAYQIPVTLVFNKIDLYSDQELQLLDELERVYSSIGHDCVRISALNETDVQAFQERLVDHVSLLSGHSGVGKSTLINGVQDNVDLKTAKISEQHQDGRHTTTFAEIVRLPYGGFIVDTPGIKGFGIIDIDKSEISGYFPEMQALLSECKFNNCNHINEPSCAVKKALKDGRLAQTRYDSYLSIYNTETEDSYR